MTSHPRKLVRGIYVPVATFFNSDEDQTLDIETHKEHILWIARAGVQGFLVHGSTGEAVSLTPEEKVQVCVHKRSKELCSATCFPTYHCGLVDSRDPQGLGREWFQ